MNNKKKIRESTQKCSGKDADEIYKPKWSFYTSLLFLKKAKQKAHQILMYSKMIIRHLLSLISMKKQTINFLQILQLKEIYILIPIYSNYY